MANLYTTTGELLLDIALLRSLNDAVQDPLCTEAMERINQYESRHIAVDFAIAEYYASEEFARDLVDLAPASVGQRLRAVRALGGLFGNAAPFFRGVFFGPMDRLDPCGRRVREAVKRIQLLGAKGRVRRRPFGRFLLTLQWFAQRKRPKTSKVEASVSGARLAEDGFVHARRGPRSGEAYMQRPRRPVGVAASALRSRASSASRSSASIESSRTGTPNSLQLMSSVQAAVVALAPPDCRRTARSCGPR
ncbi:MAG: hypothetical protein D6731_11665 [Planctomycetota bacterium]|nr:MAG: hypothetical protein D6731_11665 [Planctomycetota bacterium]